MELLKPYREKIDTLDDAIVDLLAERMNVVREVAALKAEHGIPAILEDRIEAVRERCARHGAEKGLDEEFIRRLYTLLITHACDIEEEIIHTS